MTTHPAGSATVSLTAYWTVLDSPLGQLLLTADESGALTSLSVPGQKGGRTVRSVEEGGRHDPGPFRAAESSSPRTSPVNSPSSAWS